MLSAGGTGSFQVISGKRYKRCSGWIAGVAGWVTIIRILNFNVLEPEGPEGEIIAGGVNNSDGYGYGYYTLKEYD